MGAVATPLFFWFRHILLLEDENINYGNFQGIRSINSAHIVVLCFFISKKTVPPCPSFANSNLRTHSYPMPTIALINGHGFAGALMTAMMHDYRIMNPHRGYICLNEVELGVPLKAAMSSIFRQKTSPQTYRTLVLEGKRYKALEALEAGIVDGVGGLDEVVAFVEEFKLVSKTDKGVYGKLKREMWRETVAFLDAPDEEEGYKERVKRQDEELERKARERVKDWETAKAKL